MRIALLTPSTCDDPSGLAILHGLASEFSKAGHDVILLGQHKPYRDKPARETASWGRIHRLGGLSESWLLHAVLMFAQAWRLLRTCDFVHVRVNGQADFRMMAALLACRWSQAPYGVTFDDFDNPSHFPRSTSARWRVTAAERLLAGAAWVAAVSRAVAAGLEREMPALRGRVRVMRYGLDLRGLAASSSSEPEPGSFLLCIARLMPYKGIDVLLMAWSQVCGDFTGVELIVYGSDDTDGHYRQLARRLGLDGRVRFVGDDQRRKWALLRSCLFFVLPSRHEAFGLAIVEAMSCGKAVLATRSGGPQEIIEDGKTGLLVPPQDVAAMAGGLARLLSEPALRGELGRRARSAAAEYSLGKSACAYLEAMEGHVAP